MEVSFVSTELVLFHVKRKPFNSHIFTFPLLKNNPNFERLHKCFTDKSLECNGFKLNKESILISFIYNDFVEFTDCTGQ